MSNTGQKDVQSVTPEEAASAIRLAKLKTKQTRRTLWAEDWRRADRVLHQLEELLDYVLDGLNVEVEKRPRG